MQRAQALALSHVLGQQMWSAHSRQGMDSAREARALACCEALSLLPGARPIGSDHNWVSAITPE